MRQKASRQGMEKGVATIVSHLEQRVADLRQELAGVESDLLQARSFRDVLGRVDESVFVVVRRRGGTHETDVTEAILVALSEEQPLHRKELMCRVEAAGIHIGGKKPLDTFASYLTNDPRFCSVVGHSGLLLQRD